MSKKSIKEVCAQVGLKYGEASQGAHVAPSASEPTGYWFKDSATILALEPYADHLAPDLGKRIKILSNLQREAARLKKEREESEALKKKQAAIEQEKRDAELREKQESDLRFLIKSANPGISESEIESLLPEMRREQQKQKVKTALINTQRANGRKF